jgi:SAM-dependent methyltransferase
MDVEHPWEQWEWDETLFAGAAPYYERGRLPYAPTLAAAMQRALGLDGTGRLLDVGCGPGTLTLRFAHLFTEAVGLDADAGMLAEAARLAATRDITNATWVHKRAEALPAGLGTFRVVTFGASFHWLDRPRVASVVRTMLDPGGAAVHVDAPAYRPDELGVDRGGLPPVPEKAIVALRERYLGPHRRAGRGLRNTSPSGEDAVFRAAGFRPVGTVFVPDGRVIERTIDDVVANVFSSSPTAPHLFGDRREQFERDLRQVLASASPTGRFAVVLPDNLLHIWRPDTEVV